MNDKDCALLFKECKEILSEEGLLVPRTKLRFTDKLMSFVDSPHEIHLGLWVRTFGDLHRIQHSMLHEFMHILIFRIPPSVETRSVFGTPEAWEENQRLYRWLCPASDYVSRYARTHPEEDMVETAVYLLEADDLDEDDEDIEFAAPGLVAKVAAVEEWFEKIRNR